MTRIITARRIGLEDLVSTLLKEHEEFRQRLTELEEASGDKDRCVEIVSKLDEALRQHIVDEEATVLRVLLDAYGRDGGVDAIKVFKQHRPI